MFITQQQGIVSAWNISVCHISSCVPGRSKGAKSQSCEPYCRRKFPVAVWKARRRQFAGDISERSCSALFEHMKFSIRTRQALHNV
jgi:hypothetical protein